MIPLREDDGSFRDPSGRVYLEGDRVYRSVMPVAADDFEFVRDSKVLEPLIDEGKVIGETAVEPARAAEIAEGARHVIEHPRLPFISHPYEWPFPALKAAALLHLEIHLRVLEAGVTLSDATAYNIQFHEGTKPIFIDRLSFRRYREGEFWLGHRQFCEQFLNPLLLRAYLGVAHNAWFRGSLEGITAIELGGLLPLRRKLSWKVLTHVVLQGAFQKQSTRHGRPEISRQSRLPLTSFKGMLTGLRDWIVKLEPRDGGKSVWSDYAGKTSYAADEARQKRKLVAEFVAATRPGMIWDLGCNTGDYAMEALGAGADMVVGFDADHGALDKAFARSTQEGARFLPLYLDAANPTPSQGWAEGERKGVMDRARADGILALALLHHLAIGRNVPLERLAGWLVDLAPQGIVEFVPKSDPMVQELLRLREDVFDDYDEATFEAALGARAEIAASVTISESGRRLYWFKRT